MINYIHNLFNKEKPKVKQKSIQQQLLELKLGSFVAFDLNPDICFQHIAKEINRFDQAVLNTAQLKGLVKAVYKADATGFVYVEVVGLIVNGDVATRKDYVVMETEIKKFSIIG